MTAAPARLRALARAAGRAITGMPRGARLIVIGVVVLIGFIAVVFPLFATGGAPAAEISGALPETAVAGTPVRVDIAVDNVGDSIIYPVCVALTSSGASLVSGNFQGLDQVDAVGNTVCGGQLTGQETISITLVVSFSHRGTTSVTLVPRQGSSVIGPAFTQTLTVS